MPPGIFVSPWKYTLYFHGNTAGAGAFDLSGERNVPAVYSSATLLASHWTSVALIFGYLAIDEVTLHERL